MNPHQTPQEARHATREPPATSRPPWLLGPAAMPVRADTRGAARDVTHRCVEGDPSWVPVVPPRRIPDMDAGVIDPELSHLYQ